MCLELGFVWLVYFAYGIAASHEMPIWMTTTLVIFVDRIVSHITSIAETQRQALAGFRWRFIAPALGLCLMLDSKDILHSDVAHNRT